MSQIWNEFFATNKVLEGSGSHLPLLFSENDISKLHQSIQENIIEWHTSLVLFSVPTDRIVKLGDAKLVTLDPSVKFEKTIIDHMTKNIESHIGNEYSVKEIEFVFSERQDETFGSVLNRVEQRDDEIFKPHLDIEKFPEERQKILNEVINCPAVENSQKNRFLL